MEEKKVHHVLEQVFPENLFQYFVHRYTYCVMSYVFLSESPRQSLHNV